MVLKVVEWFRDTTLDPQWFPTFESVVSEEAARTKPLSYVVSEESRADLEKVSCRMWRVGEQGRQQGH